MSINHWMKVRSHGGRLSTRKQDQNRICSRYKIWSISSQRTTEWKHLWKQIEHYQGLMYQDGNTFLSAILSHKYCCVLENLSQIQTINVTFACNNL